MTTLYKSLFVANCLGVLLLLVLLGCGGGNSGIVDTGQLVIDRQSTGVTMDGFEVLRYNQEGFTDPGLNGTIGVDVSREGGVTALTISVSDPADMNSVIVNVNYDSSATHPESAEFHGLLGSEENVLSAALLDSPGTAGIGAAAIRDYHPGYFTGEFVTVYFADGPSRNVSAIGDVNHNPDGVAEQFLAPEEWPTNLTSTSNVPGGTASVQWTAGWHCGDGDQNSETNAADLVPLALFFGQTTAANWAAVVADYDLNGEVNAGDIQRIAVFFGEKTDAYVVQAGDNDGSTPTEIAQIPWTEKNDATGGADGVLNSAFDYWEVNFDGASDPSYDDMAALDGNADGFVTIYVSPVTLEGTTIAQTGAEASVDIEVPDDGGEEADNLFITGYDILIEGADDGSGGNVFDGDGATAPPSAVIVDDANTDLTFSLNGIRGTFNGVNFDADNLATAQGMQQADYDAALESARDQLSWTFGHAGAENFRRTADWIDLNSGNPNPAPFTVVGDPGAGTVFPDDDPESVDIESEGTLAISLPQGGDGTYLWNDEIHVQVLAPVAYNLTVDILEDESAPLLLDYSVTELRTIINQDVSILFEWGDGGEPGDLAGVDLQLLEYDGELPAPSIIDFDYQEGGAVNGREFSLRLTGEQTTIEAIVPGAGLQLGKAYAFRFFDGTTWSSINKPEDLLPTAQPPDPQDLLTIPSTVDRTVNYIQILYPDPVIRRNGFFIIDLNEKTALPEDEDAYNDVLKINGDEFPVAVVDYGNPPIPQAWPQIRIGPPGGSSSPVNPNIIGSLDYEGVEGILIPLLNGNRIIVDIRVLTGPPQPGDEDEYYAYKLFNADGSAVGQGQFYVPVFSISVPGPVGDGWGINAFNREEKELSDRDFSDRTLDSSRVGTQAPDVIWVEFQDGWMFDAFESPPDRPYENVHLYLQDQEAGAGTMDVNLSLRVVGLTSDSSYLAIHEVIRNDYFNLIEPGFGILRKGHVYDVSLDDNKTPAVDYDFPLPLLVTGDLPPL